MLLKRRRALRWLRWSQTPYTQRLSERLLQQEPGELLFAESSDPDVAPSTGTCSCHHQIPTSPIHPGAIWGWMYRTILRDELGLLPLPPGAGGLSRRMLSPPGHAAELMSSHSLRNERRLALAATALRKELIFTGTFSPNKGVFSGADTAQPGLKGRRGGSAWER